MSRRSCSSRLLAFTADLHHISSACCVEMHYNASIRVGICQAPDRHCLEESSTCMPTVNEKELVTFDVASGEHRHWRLTFDGRVATLAMDVNEDCGLRPGYKLKLNSYDLGVDIELHDLSLLYTSDAADEEDS